MNILHTSDFHLGKKLYKKSREEEHTLFLSWLYKTVKERSIDILIIAGDVFDSPVPTTKALKMYFDFLNKTSELERLKKIIIISGNHDSGHFLEAPLSFLSRQKIHVSGQIYHDHLCYKNRLDFKISQKNIRIGCFPFFRAYDFIKKNDALDEMPPEKLLLKNLKEWLNLVKGDHKGPSLLIGHHLFGRFFASGSEQTVTLSGLESLGLELFSDWDVLALGHIHKKQILRKEKPFAAYCGSPLAMRFSESNQKHVFFYQFDDQGLSKTQQIEIPCQRYLKRITITPKNYKSVSSDLAKEMTSTQLPPFLELKIKMEASESIVVDEIVQYFAQKQQTVLNMIVDYGDEQDETIGPELAQVYQLEAKELFSHYLDSCDIDRLSQNRLSKIFKNVLSYSGEEES